MALRLINAALVRQLLPMDRCIDLMRDAFRLEAEKGVIQPIRSLVRKPDGRGVIGMMPAYTARPEWLGIKVVTVFPGNFGTGKGSHQGMVLMFEAETGSPVALVEAREITAIRTAAATAAATDLLARKDAASLGILGYGEQAQTHLRSVPLVRRFDDIRVWGRDPERARVFAERQSERLGLPVRAATREEAVAADVVCTVTAAAEPVLFGGELRAGQHLNVVGSSIPTTTEIDGEALVRSRVYVDFLDSALALGGDIRRALEAGEIETGHIRGSVGDVLLGKAEGRIADDQITLFKSLGMAAEDMVSCAHVLAEAERSDLGDVVEWDEPETEH